MDVNSSIAGLRVLRHVLSMDTAQGVHALARAKPFLTYEEDQKVLAFIGKHLSLYKTFPNPETVLTKLAVFLPDVHEPFEYDMQALRSRYLEDGMRAASDKASELIATGDTPAALTGMIGALLPLVQEHGGLSLTDLRHVHSGALSHYQSQLLGTAVEGQVIGYPTVDTQGVIEDGDMIGIVGRPGSGKTWMMLSTALRFWAKYVEPVLFVTQEMSARQLEKRALPLWAGVDPTPLYMGKHYQYDVHGMTHEQYMQALKDAAENMQTAQAPFLIYDSKMAGTVADIEAISAMYGTRTIFIDGAYMLRHPDPRLGRYARVPENLDLMKFFCQRTGARIISSWQFKRNAGKNTQDGETPDLDDIGYSHAIGEYKSVILGLLDNPKSLTETKKKRVTIMKGRGGETGDFDIHWDFANMNFTEVEVGEIQDSMTYL